MVDPALVTLIVVAVVAVTLATFPLVALKRAPAEKGLKPAYQERGAVVFHGPLGFGAGSNIPIYRISVYGTFLVISLLKQTIVEFEDIAEIRYGGVTTRAVRLELRGDKRSISLHVRNPQGLINSIRESPSL
jgi:hypothetical protein